MSNAANELEIQRRYYAETANRYVSMHINERDEHSFALSFMVGAIDYLRINSVLDVGSGTGRALLYLKKACPSVRILGIEPVSELREVGYKSGLSEAELIEGNATKMKFSVQEFDMVCEFGVLHHIKEPDIAVAEMLRVASKAVFISDSNNFGQGSLISRTIKQLLDHFGLWKLADLFKTRGKGYTISKGDGLSYSYSVFNNYRQIQKQCNRIYILNTCGGQINHYRTASHVAFLGVKK
jgi:ubiquinone/menaquinone biosynthesis C-methylase UbiE